MAVDPLSASRIYAAGAQLLNKAGAAGGVEEAAGAGAGFDGLVQNVLSQAATATNAAEKAGLQAVSGRADIVDVVTAVAAAESTLETVLAVRDQVIQAYQEILRMPI